MLSFLLKGLIRDRNRSFFPIIIIFMGVMVSTLMYSYLNGFMSDLISTNAVFETGHVKIMTNAYKKISNQMPNDFGLVNVSSLLEDLKKEHPDIDFSPRIKFGGLLDFPDEKGETRDQGPVVGVAMDLFNPSSNELKRLNISKALVKGKLPKNRGEILITEKFREKMKANIGDVATLISSTANGSMAIYNFKITGTINFGVEVMDRGALIADISDVQSALYMDDGAGEILGFFKNMLYDDKKAEKLVASFNNKYSEEEDFSPVMLALKDQNDLGTMLEFYGYSSYLVVLIFLISMSIVLWNTGLMSGIRRYGEMGVRLAIGESKTGVYKTLIYESLLIGIVGSIIGTSIGLGFSYYLQEVGFDISDMVKGSSLLMSNVIRAQITTTSFFIGFIPGLLAVLFGAMLSGIAIFKRQTSTLFKELEG
ncbi:MAG: FtsX-like permease family protein [Pseudomonadota bacterium]